MGPSALIGVFALVAIEYVANGGSLVPGAGGDRTFRATLERGPCLGPCPAYRVDIDGAGDVSFSGRASGRDGYGVCKGPSTWKVPAASVARLEAAVDGAGFSRLKASYIAQSTDAPANVVTITRRGRTKSVEEYSGAMAGMPAAMTALENAIDEAADDSRCIGDAAHALRGPSSIP